MKIMGKDNPPVGKPEVTKLNEKDEQEFLKWYASIAGALGQAPDPDDPLHFYDYRGFYSDLKNAPFTDRMRRMNDLVRTRHFPDTYKLPGHPTFSTQSKYYQDGMAAGTWDGDRFVLPMPEYNVFTDPKSYSARDAHRRSLDAFIKANPVVAGLRTADFADLLSAFAGLESSYRRNAANDTTSYSGWYGLRGGKDMSDDMQHRKALEHLAGILKGLTTEDMKKADERWYTPAQALYKGWNQGTGALVEFLNNGVYSTQGNNPDIGIAGNNIDVDVDLTPYLRDAITDDYYIVKEGDTFDTIQSRARHAGRHYNRAGKDLAGYNTPDIMKGKLKIGDRIWFTTPYATGGDLRSLADRIVAMGYEYSKGGKIHIKPENRGKFTALKKRTGHSASWFKAHGTPAQRKMATFALNAAKWKHADGGLLHSYEIGGPQKRFVRELEEPRPAARDNTMTAMTEDNNGPVYVPGSATPPNDVVSNVMTGLVAAPLVAGAGALAGEALAVPAVAKLGVGLLAGTASDMAIDRYTPYNGWGDMLYRGSGLKDELKDAGVTQALDSVLGEEGGNSLIESGLAFTNPFYGVGEVAGDVESLIGDAGKALEKARSRRAVNSWAKRFDSRVRKMPDSRLSAKLSAEEMMKGETRKNRLIVDVDRGVNPERTVNLGEATKPDFTSVVKEDGSVDTELLAKTYRNLLRDMREKAIVPKFGLGERYYSTNGETSLKEHIKDVVKTAQEIPVPAGSSRQELVRAALVHDIGKIMTGQERAVADAPHAFWGERLLREMPSLSEFSSPTINSAVLLHMDDELNPIFGSHGFSKLREDNPIFTRGDTDAISRQVRNFIFRARGLTPEIPEYNINWDLVHALQAADVSRGLSYDAAAIKYPQLFMYDRANPYPVKFAHEFSPELAYKTVVNPILKRQGYPVVHDLDNLLQRLRRHNSFYRGVYDPSYSGKRVGQVADGLSLDETLERAATHQSPVPSRSGRAQLFDGTTPDRKAYMSGLVSRRLKVSRLDQDGLFVSVSPHTVRGYANTHGPEFGKGYRVNFPLDESVGEGGLAGLMEKNDFQLLSADAIESGTQPMSNWQMFEQPYRLQTGRSLRADMEAAYTGQKLGPGKRKGWSFRDPRGSAFGHKDVVDQLRRIQEVFQPSTKVDLDFLSRRNNNGITEYYLPDRGTKAYVDMVHTVANPARGAVRTKVFLDDLSVQGATIESAHDPDIVKNAMSNIRIALNELSGTGNGIFQSQKARLGYFAKLNKIKERFRNEGWSPSLDQSVKELKDYTMKYGLNDAFFKRIRNNYFDILGKKKKWAPTKEFSEYMNSPESQAAFLREHGVFPLWDLPSFGKHVLVGNGGHRGSWTSSPKTRNKSLDKSAAQGYIIGKKGEKTLEINTVYPRGAEEMDALILEGGNYTKKFKDDGMRYQGEDPRYEVTRKTYSAGGHIDNYVRTNPSVVLDLVRKELARRLR